MVRFMTAGILAVLLAGCAAQSGRGRSFEIVGYGSGRDYAEATKKAWQNAAEKLEIGHNCGYQLTNESIIHSDAGYDFATIEIRFTAVPGPAARSTPALAPATQPAH